MATRECKRGSVAAIDGKEHTAAFSLHQDVLARWNDGLFYLGKVLKVDEANQKCYIKFEDDSEHWALFKDISKGVGNGEICCCLCRGDRSEVPNEIVLCDNCGLGYHQCCHNPGISANVLQPGVEFLCRICVFATTVKRGGALKKGPHAKALQAIKQSLPYNLSALTWDAHHRTNVEHCYCYCGGPGEWYMQMLQCCRCKQWFHEACMQCLEFPLVYGDRWYLFVCSICNFGIEYVKRLDIKWIDVAQLALFNLTVMHNKKYYDLNECILPWIRENWNNLHLHLASDNSIDVPSHVEDILKSNTSRFQSGSEVKKKRSLWGLRVRLPPPPPIVILPVDGQINDQVMNSVKMKGKKTKKFVPLQGSPVHLKKRKVPVDPIAQKSAKYRKLVGKAVEEGKKQGNVESVNQSYKGYNNITVSSDGKTPLNGKSLFNKKTLVNGKSLGKSRRKIKLTLDNIIPRPESFSGHNHPFKTEIEMSDELKRERLKTEMLHVIQNRQETPDSTPQNRPEIDSASQSSSAEDTDREQQPDINHEQDLIPTLCHIHPRRHRRKAFKKFADISNSYNRPSVKSEFCVLNDEVSTSTPKCLSLKANRSQDVVDSSAIEAVKSQEVSVKQLKSSVNHYFGTADRIAKGETFRVLARRITPKKVTQFLIVWEDIIP